MPRLDFGASLFCGVVFFWSVACARIIAQLPPVGPSPQPLIVQPTSHSVNLGGTAVFEGTSNSPEPFTYQWQRNGASLTNETQLRLTLETVQPCNAGYYSIVASNVFGGSVTSAPSALFVNTPGVIPSVEWQLRLRRATPYGRAIAVDPHGNLFVAVVRYPNDETEFAGHTLTNSEQQGLVLAKCTTSGSVEWMIQSGGSGVLIPTAMAADRLGNVLVGGWYLES